MLTARNFFDNLQTNLEHFPRHSGEDESEVIFSIYTNGILHDEFFEEGSVPYKKSGKILVECSKVNSAKIYTLRILFQNYEDDVTLNNMEIFQAEESLEVWNFAIVFIRLIEKKGKIHILSTKSNSDLSETYNKIFANWLDGCERIDSSC